MILSCCGPGEHCNCEDSFVPVLTEQGVCHSFNPTNTSMKETQYSKMFKKIFQNTNGDNVATINECEANMKSFEMHITLDNHQTKVTNHLQT